MKPVTLWTGTTLADRSRRVFLITGIAAIVELSALLWATVSVGALSDIPTIWVKGSTLTYYRAAAHPAPPLNLLDPYDSFEKDAEGNLVIASRNAGIRSSFAQANFNEYILKTRKGNPIIVYQETPSRRLRDKSNCHGFTFLAGDYWLLDSQVKKILVDDEWRIVSTDKVTVGDIAVYREPDGSIVHTARVVGRDADGHILVNSKNGFEPPVEAVLATEAR